MNTHADKGQEDKSRSVAHELSKTQGIHEPALQFVDNRPETIAIEKLQGTVNGHGRHLDQTLDIFPKPIIQKVSAPGELGSGVVMQLLNPNQLHDDDINGFNTLIQTLRDNVATIDWDWDHIEDRHVIEDGMEEGELRDDLDAEDAYFESTSQAAIGNLVVTCVENGNRYWHAERDVVWFIYDFGGHIGGYPDGTSATRLQVYIDTSAMEDENDHANAYITTAFPRT